MTAQVQRFCRVLQCKNQPETTDTCEADDITRAETLWVIESQKVLLRDDNFENWRKQFGLFLDDHGIWRCRGRIAPQKSSSDKIGCAERASESFSQWSERNPD